MSARGRKRELEGGTKRRRQITWERWEVGVTNVGSCVTNVGSCNPYVDERLNFYRSIILTGTVRPRGIGTGIFEASKRVLIFPFATH